MTASTAIVERFIGAGSVNRLLWYSALAVAGSMLIALAAKIQVPFWPVPMSLSTLAIFTIAAAYGLRLGLGTIFTYLALGFYGLPVFVGATAGPAYFLGPTAGYLAGFVIMVAITGWAADRGWSGNPLKLGGAMLVGETIMLGLGWAWIAVAYSAEQAFAWGVGPFIVTDLVKLAMAACLVPALWALIRRLGL